MKNILILFVSILFICSCAKGASNSKNGQEKERDTIEMPEIPSDLRDPTARADYLITHFWDKLDIKDTDKSHDRTLMEQSFVNFLSILPYSSSEAIIKNGFSNLLEKAAADPYVYDVIKSTAAAYLLNSDSPMRSEDQYICFLEALKESKNSSETELIRIEDQIEMLSKNRKGSQATDFGFECIDGTRSTLYDTLKENKELMLIFFDPECEVCEETMKQLIADTKLMQRIKEGELGVLAIYSGDNEQSWRKKAAQLPVSWKVGINKSEIEEKDLYYLPSMPTIYLLDGKGKVIEKDMQP